MDKIVVVFFGLFLLEGFCIIYLYELFFLSVYKGIMNIYELSVSYVMIVEELLFLQVFFLKKYVLKYCCNLNLVK